MFCIEKNPYGLNTRMVQLVLDRMHTVGPYEYTNTVRTVRVRSKYAYGLERIYLEMGNRLSLVEKKDHPPIISNEAKELTIYRI